MDEKLNNLEENKRRKIYFDAFTIRRKIFFDGFTIGAISAGIGMTVGWLVNFCIGYAMIERKRKHHKESE